MTNEEIKNSIETFGKNFEEFKKTNDAQIAALKEGKGVAETTEKMEKMEASFQAIEKKFETLELKQNNPSNNGAKVCTKAAKEAAIAYMKTGELSNEQASVLRKHLDETSVGYKALSVVSDADGGFTVRPEVSNNIQEKVFESSPMRQLAEVITIGSDSFEELYSDSEAGAGWVGETQSRPETSNASLKMIRIPAHEMYAMPKLTQKLIDDSALDIESWHQNKVIEKFSRIEAEAFISGDGYEKPKGILSYESGDGFDKLERIASGVSADFNGDSFQDLQTALLEEFQGNASWLMKRSIAGDVRKLKDSDGRYLFSLDPNAGLNGAMPFMLLGKSLRYADAMQTKASNALPVAYGDFRAGYKIVDRLGIRVLRDNLTQKGFVKFYTTKRVGGGVQHFQAIKLMELNA